MSPARNRLPASQLRGESGAASLISAKMACNTSASPQQGVSLKGKGRKVILGLKSMHAFNGSWRCALYNLQNHEDAANTSLLNMKMAKGVRRRLLHLACAVQGPCRAPSCLQDVEAYLPGLEVNVWVEDLGSIEDNRRHQGILIRDFYVQLKDTSLVWRIRWTLQSSKHCYDGQACGMDFNMKTGMELLTALTVRRALHLWMSDSFASSLTSSSLLLEYSFSSCKSTRCLSWSVAQQCQNVRSLRHRSCRSHLYKTSPGCHVLCTSKRWHQSIRGL